MNREIRQEFIGYNESVRSVPPYYIVVHDTGDSGATDENEHDYFAGGNRNASADFFVDSDSTTQIINTDIYYSWHCGDGAGAYGIRNSNSLGIEMCLEKDGTISEATEEATLDLVLYLMDKYNIPAERVVRHYDASRKSCPNAWSANNWAKWYDFKDRLVNGAVSSGKWILEDNKWWYQNSDGTYPRDCWKKIYNKWYLFDTSGWMLTQWKSDEGKWYYLGSDGAMKTGWVFNNNKWYYMNESGAMQTGWVKVNNEWYFLDKSTGEMHSGWLQDSGNLYLLDSKGVMYDNCTEYGYSFDSNGVATKLN